MKQDAYKMPALSQVHRILTDRFKSFTGLRSLEHDQKSQQAETWQRSIRYYRRQEAWPAKAPEIVRTFTLQHFKSDCLDCISQPGPRPRRIAEADMFCLPPLSIFSFWPQWLAFLNGKPSLENDLEEGIAEIGVYEEAKIETIPASYEGDYSASFWLPPRRVGNVSSFCKAIVRYDSEEYKVARLGQIPWSAKGSLPICFFWNERTKVQVSIPFAEAKTLIPDLPELPPNIFAAILNSLIRR